MAALVIAGASPEAADAQNEVLLPPVVPSFNRRIPQVSGLTLAPQVNARFGYSMVMGKLGDLTSDPFDDLVVAGTGSNSLLNADVGAVYPYEGDQLSNLFIPITEQFPIPEHAQLGLGERYPAIGRVDTSPAFQNINLVFFPAPRQQSVAGLPNEGVVHVFQPLAPSPHVKALRPPGGARSAMFGEAIAIGDVNGDGVDDLVVGAPGTRNCTLFGQGRVYIFFGGNGWLQTPANMLWVAINSPLTPVGCAGSIPTTSQESFGLDVKVVDLNDDGFGELVVGAPGRLRGAVGSAYIYDGSAIATLATGQVHDVGSPGAVPSQTLFPPAPYNNTYGNFGWTVYSIGNMGGNIPSTWTTGRPDIVIHGEGTNFSQAIPIAGSMFVYFGDDTPGTSLFVDPNPVALFSPVVEVNDASGNPVQVHGPQAHSRFGRSAAVVRWPITENGELRDHLLVGDPDADVQDPNDPLYPAAPLIPNAGRVYAYQAPLHLVSHQTNAWSGFVLLEPQDTTPETLAGPFAVMSNSDLGPSPESLFGSWIVAGNYTAGTEGDEFVVSSRQKAVPWPTQVSPKVTGAGQVYSFRVPD